jgi:AraC-like DNA-binding protein
VNLPGSGGYITNERKRIIMSTVITGYNEYTPPTNLRSYLDCYWSYVADTEIFLSHKQLIIPDGCVDIIFDLNPQTTLKSFVIGAMTKPIVNNRTNLVGVRFKPGMAYPFIKIPVQKLTDLLVDYFEFVGLEAYHLSIQLVDLNSTEHQIALLNSIFSKKLSALNAFEIQMSRALNLIQSTGGRISIKQISDEIGWSRQHFTRKCLSYTGLTPKFLTQVIRIKKVIKETKTERFCNWSQLSVDGGYYDQSHMINEFKKITGLTPIEFLSRT